MSQVKITDAFQPKKRTAHKPKHAKEAVIKAEPAYHPEDQKDFLSIDQEALPSTPKTVEEEELEMLRQFDLNHEFGPCRGITRLERWQRAVKHKLNPPEKVREVVLNHLQDVKYSESVWFSYNI